MGKGTYGSKKGRPPAKKGMSKRYVKTTCSCTQEDLRRKSIG